VAESRGADGGQDGSIGQNQKPRKHLELVLDGFVDLRVADDLDLLRHRAGGEELFDELRNTWWGGERKMKATATGADQERRGSEREGRGAAGAEKGRSFATSGQQQRKNRTKRL